MSTSCIPKTGFVYQFVVFVLHTSLFTLNKCTTPSYKLEVRIWLYCYHKLLCGLTQVAHLLCKILCSCILQWPIQPYRMKHTSSCCRFCNFCFSSINKPYRKYNKKQSCLTPNIKFILLNKMLATILNSPSLGNVNNGHSYGKQKLVTGSLWISFFWQFQCMNLG